MKRLLTLFLCVFMALTCTSIVKADGATVYVDPSGADGAYASLELAAKALPSEGGTIVIKVDADTSLTKTSVTLTAKGKIRIVGENPSVRLTQKKALIANCELEIDSLTLVNGAAYGFDNILCQGNNVTIGSGVTTLPNGSRYINIYAGKTKDPLSGVNSNVNIHGGQWKNVYGANNSKAFSGTVNFDFANTTIEAFALSGNSDSTSTATINAAIKNGTNISSIQKTYNTGTYTGTATVTLEGGTIGGITDVIPNIDLSDGGNLTLNSTSTVGTITGGGNLNLGSGATLTASDLVGTTNLSIATPVTDTTYLTVNNTAATGSINYIPQSTEVLNRTVGSAIEYTIGAAAEPVVIDTVYLDPAGTSSHTEHVYTSMGDAIDALPVEGGTVIVCSDADYATTTTNNKFPAKPIHITGESSDVVITQKRALFVGADTLIDNITIAHTMTSNQYIYTQGYNLTIGDNVTCTPYQSNYISIFMGSASGVSGAVGPIADGDGSITIKSGTFKTIFGGGLSCQYDGISTINIQGGTITNNVFLTGSSAVEGSVNGTANVTISGGTIPNLKKNNSSAVFTGTENIVLKGGTINNIADLTPEIDLSEGGTLNLNVNTAVSDLIGGGTLNLGDGVTLTADDLTGTTALSIANPVYNTTYLTINNTSATGSINYIPKATETLERTVGVSAIEYTIVPTEVIDTVYVDPAGTSSHTEHVYSTVEDAINAITESSGTVYICSDVNFNPSSAYYILPNKEITIVGEDSDVRLNQIEQIFLTAPLTIENLTLVNGAGSDKSFIFTQGNDFTVGEGMTCVPSGAYYICILAGSRGYDDVTGHIVNGDSTITLKSGTFRRVFGAGMNSAGGQYNGKLTINLEGANITNNVYASGSGSGADFSGTYNLNVKDGSINSIKKNSDSGGATGTFNVVLEAGDITEFDDYTPNINLSQGGVLVLNDSLTVGDIVGGGSLQLGANVTLTADSLTGTTDLYVDVAKNDFAYVTINDASTAGILNYASHNEGDSLEKVVGANDVQFIGKLITHDKTAQGILEPNGTVDLVFAATIDDSVDLSTAYIMINEEKTFLSDIADSNNRITIATPSVNPKQIADQFEICLYDGNDNPISSETNISVMDYVYTLINGSSNAAQKDFYKSLLNYGAYAQTYFDYNLSTLANAGLSTAEKDVSAVSTSDVAPYVVNNEGSTEGISPYGQSLTLNNEVSYKVYFKLDGTHSISEYEFKDGERILTPHRYNDTYYYVRINNLAAPDLDTSHTISVKCNGVGSLNTTCSVLTYANIVLNDTNTSEKDLQLVDVAKALFLYNQKADAILGG